jgi:F420-dependent oxidoreductase-like protein
MKIVIQARITGREPNAIDDLLVTAREVHGHGLDFSMPQLFDIDALTALTIVGREVPGLGVGTAVVPTYGRHPVVMAMQALATQAATGGRLTLGIGLSHKGMVEQVFGVPYARPAKHMRDYLEILISLLHEGHAEYAGDEYRSHTITPMRVAGADAPDVLVAAMGAEMLKVTGALADGTSLWMVGPKTVADHIVPLLTQSAESAGRPRPQVVVGLPISVTADPEAARTKAATVFGHYANMPSYSAMLEREGATEAADIAIVGDEEAVAAQIRHLTELGATCFRASVFGNREEHERTHELLGHLAKE